MLAVRAAVAGGAEEVGIKLSYREVRVEIHLDEEPLKTLGESFLRAEDQHSRAAQILNLSLGGAFDQDISEAQIAWPGWRLTTDGQVLKGQISEEPPGLMTMVFERTGRGFLSLRSRVAGEHQAVSTRCRYSSVPIRLDGRVLTSREAVAERVPEKTSGLPRGLVLAEAFLRIGPDSLRLQPSEVSVVVLHTENKAVERGHAGELRPGSVFFRVIERDFGAYFYLSGLRGKGQLQIVKDGVCLEPIESKSWLPGSRMVVRDEKIETDLTQLKARESIKLESLEDWVTQQNLKMCGTLQEEVYQLKGYRSPSLTRMKISLAIGGMGALWGVVGGPASTIVMGGLATLIGYAFAGSSDTALMERVVQYLARYRATQPS